MNATTWPVWLPWAVAAFLLILAAAVVVEAWIGRRLLVEVRDLRVAADATTAAVNEQTHDLYGALADAGQTLEQIRDRDGVR
ncbi:hypothetical protein [Pseudonocardia parietis]|uniref:Uncharacterized protein n=1 Tax=Pseudonocardia parietis TaxID=570936 RepID=A0ABS4W220_9PSEU|nr:hypothetical protein [Pseudonocardia parietis]MBP2370250.1 hypothetical protein [Pseudonocardia parietis]